MAVKPRPPLADEWLVALSKGGDLASLCSSVLLVAHARTHGHWRWQYCGMRPGYRRMVNMECRRCGARYSIESVLLDMELT